MMNTVKAIKHADDALENRTIVNWCLGNTCNFACSYCPENLHSGSVKWIPIDAAVAFCTKLCDHYRGITQEIEFLFTGGEPTMYPHFPELLKLLKANDCKVAVISNGSRTVRWWLSNLHLFDKVILTFHHEFANKEHFEEVAKLLSGKVDLHLNFTMPPEAFEQTVAFAEALDGKLTDYSSTLKPLLIDFGNEMYSYSQEQLDTLKTKRFRNTLKRGTGSGLMAEVSETKTVIRKAVDFILKNENHWQGWACRAGVELIYIDFKGDVYRGTCKVGGLITNVYLHESFNFPKESIICGKKACHCLSDIMTTKTRLVATL